MLKINRLKILITGFSGFVSQYFLEYLNQVEPNATVLGVARTKPNFDFAQFDKLHIQFESLDLLDKLAVEKIITEFQPEYILHLAAISSVAQSWQNPFESFTSNINIFLNIVEPIRLQKVHCKILSVGSSEEYGAVDEALLPLTEEHLTKPLNPYAAARVSQEMLSKIYADGYDVNIVMTRTFNHIGARQKDKFVIASFAKQLVAFSKNNATSNKIITGDVSIVRDFLDVRDVVEAYYLLLKKGVKGEVYNICSGKGIELKNVIDMLSNILNIKVKIEQNPLLVRPLENKKIIGSYDKIKNQLGWQPNISLQASLQDIVSYWKNELQ